MNDKQFEYGETDLFEWVEGNGKMISTKECVNKLNDQQAMIDKLTSQLQGLCNDFERVVSENSVLRKENEKLKEEWEFSFRTEMALHRVAEKELKEKIKKQQSIIEDLKKENEHYKKNQNMEILLLQ